MNWRSVLIQESNSGLNMNEAISIISSTNAFPSYWNTVLLEDLGEISGGGTPSTKIPDYWEGEIPWLTPSEVTRHGSIFISKTERYITNTGLADSASKLLPVGTVMMTSRATIGEVVINEVPMATNQGFINIICDKSKTNNYFLAYWIMRNKHPIEARGHGVTFKEILKSSFKSIIIHLPPLPEQRAIAHILQTVQSAIQARRKEIELEREHKAALMQYLFTHGTRNEPTKMSEIGELPKSWSLAQLKKIIQSPPQNGAFIKNPQMGKGTLYVNVFDTYQNTIVDLKGIERLECDVDTIRRYSLQENDMIFVRSSLKREGIGQCCLIKNLMEPAIFDCHLIKLSPNLTITDPLYLVYYFSSGRGKSDLIARSKTTTMTTMNQNTLIETVFPLPSKKEQQEIIDCLSTCDSNITALEKELALHEELFRALLDELMTGRLSAQVLIENWPEKEDVL